LGLRYRPKFPFHDIVNRDFNDSNDPEPDHLAFPGAPAQEPVNNIDNNDVPGEAVGNNNNLTNLRLGYSGRHPFSSRGR